MRYLLYIFILFSLPIFGQNLNQIRPDTAAGSVPMTMAPLFRMEYVRPQTLADTLAPYLPSGHSAVTLSGPYDYITLSGQDIIRGQIDLTTDVTGLLPGTNINSITESQISDLDHFTGADITGSETAFNGWDKDASNDVTELSDLTDVNTSTPTNRNVLVADGVDWESRALVEADISDLSHFTPSNLLTDYGFTDNSTNWNTAYGWGDHSLAGYLTTDTHIGNTDLIATGNRLIDFDTNSLTIFDVSALALTSLGQFTLTGAGSQIYATNAGVGITANGLRNITMDADSAVYISTWSGNIELASGEDFVIQTYGATLNDLRFDIDGGIFFVNELPELTTPTDTLLVRSGTGELMWMHAQALRQFGSTGEVGWTDPLWDDNYGNYFVAVTQGSVSSPVDGEVPVYNSSIFGFELRSLANEFNVTISNDTIFQNDNFIVLPPGVDSLGRNGTPGQIVFETATKAPNSESTLFWDAANDRLGIGTNTPGAEIHIQKASAGNVDFRVQNTSTGNATFSLVSAAGEFRFAVNGSTGDFIFTDASGPTFPFALRKGAPTNAFNMKNTGQLQLSQYGDHTFTGALGTFLASETDGDIIERTAAEVLTDIGAQPAGSYVSSNFTKTSSTTLSDITGLTANVEAGQSYAFEAILYTTSDPASGVKAAIGGTATATSIIYEGNTMNVNLLGGQTRATSLGSTVAAVTATSAAKIHITGTIVVNAGGTLTVQFAQNVSGGTGSVVLAGSSFEVIPVN